jgi:hypothetical protein
MARAAVFQLVGKWSASGGRIGRLSVYPSITICLPETTCRAGTILLFSSACPCWLNFYPPSGRGIALTHGYLQSILELSDLHLVSRELGLEALVELLIGTVQIYQLLVLLNFPGRIAVAEHPVINATAHSRISLVAFVLSSNQEIQSRGLSRLNRPGSFSVLALRSLLEW